MEKSFPIVIKGREKQWYPYSIFHRNEKSPQTKTLEIRSTESQKQKNKRQ